MPTRNQLTEKPATPSPTISPDGRRAAIVQVAIPVILRYGIRKTSMDEIAAAAKLSRQGLYLFFPGKEALFREVIGYLAGLAVESLRGQLARTDVPLQERLLAGFEAMSSTTIAGVDPAAVRELFTSAAEIASGVLAGVDQQILSEIAQALGSVREGALPEGTDARILAEHLYFFSYGLQVRGYLGTAYRKHMETAVHVVCSAVVLPETQDIGRKA